jgi:hypothetical protein
MMTISQPDLEELVRKAILLYNRLKSPEINVKRVFVSPAIITVSFSGGFCYGCGILDYVEGFAQQFKALGGNVELKLGKTREINPRSFEADYIVKAK